MKITKIRKSDNKQIHDFTLDTAGEVWSYVLKSGLAHHLSAYRKFLKQTIGYKQYKQSQIPNVEQHLKIVANRDNLLAFFKTQTDYVYLQQ